MILARKRKVKTLKPSFFVSGVVGSFVGFPRHKRVVDGYARCLLCKVDLCIAGRGLSNLWDHWRGVEHTRLEQKYRIMTHKSLLDKSCHPVSMEEDKRIRLERMAEPPVYLESPLGLTVEERIAIEEAEAESGNRPELSGPSTQYLWLCCFINAFLQLTSVRSLVQFMESWSIAMESELRLSLRTMGHAQCQVMFLLYVFVCMCCVVVTIVDVMVLCVCSCVSCYGRIGNVVCVFTESALIRSVPVRDATVQWSVEGLWALWFECVPQRLLVACGLSCARICIDAECYHCCRPGRC